MKGKFSSLIGLGLIVSSVAAGKPAKCLDGGQEPLVLASASGPLFVSDTAVTLVLESPDDPRIELSEKERQAIRRSYEQAILREESLANLGQLTRSGCLIPPLHWDRSPHDRDAMSVQDLVDFESAAVVGIVKQVVPGLLYSLPGEIVSAVFVEIEEVKKSNPKHEPFLDELFYFQFSGRAEFGGKEICSENEGFYEAEVGDRLLLLGNTYHGVPGLFRQNQAFRITNTGMIKKEPYDYLSADQEMPAIEILAF